MNIDYKSITKHELKSLYQTYSSTYKLGNYLGISHETARLLLHKHSLCKPKKKYIYNRWCFSHENETPEQFYWAGFLAADGNISKQGRLTIDLSVKDKLHLLKLKVFIQTNAPITEAIRANGQTSVVNGDKHYVRLRLTAKQMSNDLKRFGVIPRKTWNHVFPNWLKTHALVSHFMRGYLDGDGCICYSADEQIHINICGTPIFLESYRGILEQNCSLKRREYPINISEGCGRLQYGGNVICKRICQFLYKDSSIYLERKKNQALKAFDLDNSGEHV
jgi:hypothetical protein